LLKLNYPSAPSPRGRSCGLAASHWLIIAALCLAVAGTVDFIAASRAFARGYMLFFLACGLMAVTAIINALRAAARSRRGREPKRGSGT
jgi:hypothetical protein